MVNRTVADLSISFLDDLENSVDRTVIDRSIPTANTVAEIREGRLDWTIRLMAAFNFSMHTCSMRRKVLQDTVEDTFKLRMSYFLIVYCTIRRYCSYVCISGTLVFSYVNFSGS